MACFNPLKGYRALTPNPSGKYSISFTLREGYKDLPIEISCGQCIACRLERSRQWATRCMHEAQMHTDNTFITLTYNDQHLPQNNSLNKKHFQNFMKRLRNYVSDIDNQDPNLGLYPGSQKIRFFHCGEYGEKTYRPHYHAILFNFEFQNKQHIKTHNENKLYTAPLLEKLWPYGHSMIGAATFESAAYVARYILKKVTGKKAQQHYEIVDDDGNPVDSLTPEYVTMSRRPGIGKNWYDKYKKDLYPSDFAVIRGKKVSVPKVYNGYYELEDPDAYAKLKAHRKQKALRHADENTFPRLRTKRELAEIKQKQIKRETE
ncbi:MAG: replication initiator protein [Arizlama microvirus]|nr:MAG: replication initiator protein [Arizlama microvirus]